MKLPIFPLNTVLFPGQILPLNIFEDRYKAMVQRCLRDRMGFGVALIKQAGAVRSPATPFSIGTVAQIVQIDEQAGGNYGVVCRGEERFRISALDRSGAEYLQAEMEPYPDEPAPAPALMMVAARVAQLFDEYYRGVIAMMGGWQKEMELGGNTWLFDLLTLADRQARIAEGRVAGVESVQPHLTIPTLPEEPSALSYVVAGELTVGLEVKQDLLEAPSALLRLQKEAEVLTNEMPSVEERVRLERRRRFTSIEQMN